MDTPNGNGTANAPTPDPAPLLLIDAAEVARRLSISKSSVWRLRDRGLLPQPVRLGSIIRWRAAEVEVFAKESRELTAYQSRK